MADYLSRQEPQSGPAVPAQSLMTDVAHCNDHARTLLETVRRLADTLHGAHPRDTPNLKGQPESEPTMRRYIDQQMSLLSDIDQELRAIGNRL